MSKKKALLLLSGGRSLPDLLVLKYLQPDITFNITTTQGQANALYFRQFARTHYNLDMEVIAGIDPFNESTIKGACLSAIDRFPDAEWMMHITTSPKIVGIYAYEIAKERHIPCWFLDTEGKQVVSLIQQAPDNNEQLFKANVEEYMSAYGRTYEIPKSPMYRSHAQSWYLIAQAIVQHVRATQLLLKAVRAAQPGSLLIDVERQAESLLQQLATLNALSVVQKNGGKLKCAISNGDMLEFLKGDWLEVYVWTEAMKAQFVDDCQWGYKIVADIPANELDLVLTYNARLLIAECKTSRAPFETDYLYKLHSVADLVGGNYVRQVYITNTPEPETHNVQFDNFCQQARLRRIIVVTGEQLSQIGPLLKQQMGAAGSSAPPIFRSF